MALRNGWPAVSGAVSQFDMRHDLRGLVFRDASGNVRSGIIPPVASPLVTPNSNMTVAIAPFPAVIDRNGPVFLTNDAITTSPTFGAAPSANSRIDLLWVKQQETASPISDSADGPIFGVTAGTASATPTAPSAPAGALPLYTAQIPAGASTMASSGVVLTPVFPYTSVGGGRLQVRSSAELTPALSAPMGQEAIDSSTGLVWIYSGSSWSTEKTLHLSNESLSLVGTPTDAMAPIIKAGTTALATDLNGFGSIVYKTPFPSGLISVVAVNGDNTVKKGYVDLGTSQQTTDQIHFRLDGITAPHLCRINWIAIGW